MDEYMSNVKKLADASIASSISSKDISVAVIVEELRCVEHMIIESVERTKRNERF